MRLVTSFTLFSDAVGMRISITYSEIDVETGTVVSDNNRIDRLITDTKQINTVNTLKKSAQAFVDALEG